MGRDIIIEEEGIGGIVLYQTTDGQTNLEVKLENDTVWLTRQQMALLFGRDVKTIGKHINNALKEELAGELVVAKFATPKKYGRREGFGQPTAPDRSRKGINRYLLFIKMYKAIAALVPESSLGNQLNFIVKSSKQAMPASLSTL